MAVDTSIVGKSTGKTKIVVERGAVSNFAGAITDDNPVYHDLEAAKAAGFTNIPAPATFGFVAGFWGAFKEIQPVDAPVGNPGFGLIAKLRQEKGGTILHGEQEFEYHRPIHVGDVLVSEGKVVDVYERESKGALMTFVIMDTEFRDEKTGELVLTSRFNLLHRAPAGK